MLSSVLFPAPTPLSFFFVLLPSLPSNCRLKAFADTLCWCIVEMVIGYKYIELRGSPCFVYDDSRKCDGKLALVVMWLVVSVTYHIHRVQQFGAEGWSWSGVREKHCSAG